MSKPTKTPMTQKRASEIQRHVDRKPSPTPKDQAFKVRTSRAAAHTEKK